MEKKARDQDVRKQIASEQFLMSEKTEEPSKTKMLILNSKLLVIM